jgi:RNA polymerase primary sigma factor
MSVEKIEEYLGYTSSTTSLDAPLSVDCDTTIGETLYDKSAQSTDALLLADSLRHDLQVAMKSLRPSEQHIIRLYYGMDGEPQSMDLIAMEMHLSRERIRQLINNGVDKIRQLHGKALLKYA